MSILVHVKKLLDVDENEIYFDSALISYIEEAIVFLVQNGAEIDILPIDESTDWPVFDNILILPIVKSYITEKVRLAFDPPKTNAAIKIVENRIGELYFRLELEIPLEKQTEETNE